MQPDLLVTLGDPAGIGAEVTFKALSLLDKNARGRFLLIGSAHCLQNAPCSAEASDSSPFQTGVENAASGASALAALNRAIALLKTGAYRGLVTAPLSKKAVVLAGVSNFRGHTGYLGDAFGCRPEMVFYSPKWSVLLVTVHTPLKEVTALLTPARMEEALLHAWEFQQKYCSNNTPIALCGLNPHAGEGGTIGCEEQEIFIPLAARLRERGIPIDGPLPGDTVFRMAEQGAYSMLVSPYHDQALAPFKLLHFQDGVNVSTGLPFLRCSPDHGCAFSLAGTHTADPLPMLHALKFALKNCPR